MSRAPVQPEEDVRGNGDNGLAHAEGAAHRARNQARIAGEILVRADVDEGRGVGPSDEAGELVGRDGVEGGHADASLPRVRTRCLGMSPRGEIAIPMRVMKVQPRDFVKSIQPPPI